MSATRTPFDRGSPHVEGVGGGLDANSILALGDQLVALGVERVVLESTSDYWRPFFKGNRYLKGVLGEIATAAAKTDTFLGARYKRLVKRRGKQRALVAVARSGLVVEDTLDDAPSRAGHLAIVLA